MNERRCSASEGTLEITARRKVSASRATDVRDGRRAPEEDVQDVSDPKDDGPQETSRVHGIPRGNTGGIRGNLPKVSVPCSTLHGMDDASEICGGICREDRGDIWKPESQPTGGNPVR